MAHQIVELECPGCGVPITTSTRQCPQCFREIVISTFNSVNSMSPLDINKQANAYRKAMVNHPDDKTLNMSIAFCYLKLKLYRCDNGITVLHPQESEIVKRICESYLKGQSLLTIATWLNEEQIEYMPGVIGWNKARLKRIIEDERYLGKEPYPAILAEETYTAMQQIKEKRNTQKDTDRKTDIFQIAVPVKCPNCGKRLIRRHDSRCKIQQRWICENKNCRLLIAIADSDLLETVSGILADITPESIRVSEPSNNEPSIEVRQLNNDISRMLGAPQIDKDALRKKMMECISQKYKDLDEEAHTARKLQADFDRADTEDYKKTLNRTVSEIILYTDLTVGIILLNGQLIRRE